jgi:alcohol oxidase
VQEGRPTHGYSGPLKVSMGGAFSNISKQFLDVAAGYDEERGFTDDVNALHSCNMYGVSLIVVPSVAIYAYSV